MVNFIKCFGKINSTEIGKCFPTVMPLNTAPPCYSYVDNIITTF